MKQAIKYKKIHSLIKEYNIERDKILNDSEADYQNIEEYDNNIFIGNYCFVDIRKEKKWKENRVPAMEITREELLFNYEHLLDKNKTYIIIDEDGIKAAFICHVLQYFGYDCVYLAKGFIGYQKWCKPKYSKRY